MSQRTKRRLFLLDLIPTQREVEREGVEEEEEEEEEGEARSKEKKRSNNRGREQSELRSPPAKAPRSRIEAVDPAAASLR